MITQIEQAEFRVNAEYRDDFWYAIVRDRNNFEIYITEDSLNKNEALGHAKLWIEQKLAYRIVNQINENTLFVSEKTGLKDPDNIFAITEDWFNYADNEYESSHWKSVDECWQLFIESSVYEPRYEVGMIVKWHSYNFEAIGQIESVYDTFCRGQRDETIVCIKPLPSFQHGYCLTPAIDKDTVDFPDRYITGVVLEPLSTDFNQLSIFDITVTDTTEITMNTVTTSDWDAVDNSWDYMPTEIQNDLVSQDESLESLLAHVGASSLVPVKVDLEVRAIAPNQSDKVGTTPQPNKSVAAKSNNSNTANLLDPLPIPKTGEIDIKNAAIVLSANEYSESGYFACIRIVGRFGKMRKTLALDAERYRSGSIGTNAWSTSGTPHSVEFEPSEFRSFSDRLPVLIASYPSCPINKCQSATPEQDAIARRLILEKYYGLNPDHPDNQTESAIDTVDHSFSEPSTSAVDTEFLYIEPESVNNSAIAPIASAEIDSPTTDEASAEIAEPEVNASAIAPMTSVEIDLPTLDAVSAEIAEPEIESVIAKEEKTGNSDDRLRLSDYGLSVGMRVIFRPHMEWLCKREGNKPYIIRGITAIHSNEERIEIESFNKYGEAIGIKFYALPSELEKDPDLRVIPADLDLNAKVSNKQPLIEDKRQTPTLESTIANIEGVIAYILKEGEWHSCSQARIDFLRHEIVMSLTNEGVITQDQSHALAIATNIIDYLKIHNGKLPDLLDVIQNMSQSPINKTTVGESSFDAPVRQVIVWHRINTAAIAQTLASSDAVERLYKAVAASDPELAQALFVQESLEITPTPAPCNKIAPSATNASTEVEKDVIVVDTQPPSSMQTDRSTPKQPKQPKQVKPPLQPKPAKEKQNSVRSVSPEKKIQELESLKSSVDAKGKKVVAEELGYSDTSTINANLIGYSVITSSAEVKQWFLDGKITWSDIRETRKQINKIGLNGVVENLQALATK